MVVDVVVSDDDLENDDGDTDAVRCTRAVAAAKASRARDVITGAQDATRRECDRSNLHTISDARSQAQAAAAPAKDAAATISAEERGGGGERGEKGDATAATVGGVVVVVVVVVVVEPWWWW